jgi:hypothetical protein
MPSAACIYSLCPVWRKVTVSADDVVSMLQRTLVQLQPPRYVTLSWGNSNAVCSVSRCITSLSHEGFGTLHIRFTLCNLEMRSCQKITDIRFLRRFIFNIDYSVVSLHPVTARSVEEVSEILNATIFSVEVSWASQYLYIFTVCNTRSGP